LTQIYYKFKVENLTDYCDVIHPGTNIRISDPLNYIKLGKEYLTVDDARDPTSKFYNKYIPYYEAAPIISVEDNKLILLNFCIEDFYDDSELILDENGFAEIERLLERDFYFDVITRDLTKSRNDKIHDFLECDVIEKTINDIFNGDFLVFDE
jgi:hypothetical protein